MSKDVPIWAGYLCAGIAGVCFGSNFVPVKMYSSQIGDGMFFQWIFCTAVWIAGFIVFLSLDRPTFEPLAMLGGFLWCTGNIMSVPIIKCIGLSLGMLIWGVANLLTGWLSGTAGFIIRQETVNIVWLNYIGAFIAAVSGASFAFIKPAETNEIDEDKNVNTSEEKALIENQDFIDSLSPWTKKIAGTIMAVIAGILYGTNFLPPQYLLENCPTCPQKQIDYVFPHFCGIYISSTFYFLMYCLIRKNQPIIPPAVAYPGFLSGLMWALADVSWFVANSGLDLVVSYPIVTLMPGVIASLWGIFAFNEISGPRNLKLFGFGFTLSIVSVICTVISKQGI